MKLVLEDNRRFVLRFDKGEDVVAGIADFLQSKKFEAAAFWGIGSCHEIELGYYNGNLKEYRKKPFYEDMEVISLQGSGAVSDGKAAIHVHGMFGRTDFTTIGGHVFRLITAATCEVVLIHLDGKLERKNNLDFNLNLLQ